jgi:hypothetical protein
MWSKKLILGCVILCIGIFLLFQPLENSTEWVRADAPTPIPSVSARGANAAQSIFIPFVSNTYSLTLAPLWRFGVDKVRRSLASYNSLDVAYMRFGWYVNFSATASPEIVYGMDYMPMVRMKQYKRDSNGNPTLCCVGCGYYDPPMYTTTPSTSTIQSIAASRPGMTWVLGNEMERIDWGALGGVCGAQDEMLPEVYAQAYHDVYAVIKNADPTAQVAAGALVQPSPLRIKYMDRVWAEYTSRYMTTTMPVDVWNIHVYVYNEKSCTAFPADCWGADIPAGLTETVGLAFKIRDHKDFTKASAMLVNWRTWMKNHGQQNKPLITTEYGVVLPEWVQDPELPGQTIFSPTQIRDSFMYPSFNYFLNQTSASLGYPADGNRLMQRWAWWSMDYDDGECDGGVFYPDNTGNLFNSGIGPSFPPKDCAYPDQSRSAFGTYWAQYVQALPAGASKPYAPVQSTPTMTNAPATTKSSAARMVASVPVCSDSPEKRNQLLRSLPSRDTAEGKQVWLSVLSNLTGGTRLCLPGQ